MRCLVAVSSWFVQPASSTSVTSPTIIILHRTVRSLNLQLVYDKKESIIGVQWFQKNHNPWVHRSEGNSASLVFHLNGGPSGWDFSVPTGHQWWILSHIPKPALGKDKKGIAARRPHAGRTFIHDGIVMLKWRHHTASQRIQDFLEVFFMFFQDRMRYLVVNKKRIHYSCEDGIGKSFPRDHRLSSLIKPLDANRWSSGRIFLSTLTPMKDSYILPPLPM